MNPFKTTTAMRVFHEWKTKKNKLNQMQNAQDKWKILFKKQLKKIFKVKMQKLRPYQRNHENYIMISKFEIQIFEIFIKFFPFGTGEPLAFLHGKFFDFLKNKVYHLSCAFGSISPFLFSIRETHFLEFPKSK